MRADPIKTNEIDLVHFIIGETRFGKNERRKCQTPG